MQRSNEKKIVLIGGGGHCRSVIDVAETAGREILGIIDDFRPVGDSVLGYPVIGSDRDIEKYVGEAEFIVTVGQVKDAGSRKSLHERVLSAGGKFATLISPLAHVSKYAQVGEGTVVMHNAVINAGAIIGNGCIINTACNIEHDAIVGALTHISTGAMINGGAVIGSEVMVGSGAVVLQSIVIDNGCVIGAGAVVTRPTEEIGIYVGVPAKFLKSVE